MNTGSLLDRFIRRLYPVFGTFIITVSLSFDYALNRTLMDFFVVAALIWFCFLAGYYLLKFSYVKIAKAMNFHIFDIDELFFVFSLFFVIKLSDYEILSIVWFAFVLLLFFLRLQNGFSSHPSSFLWKKGNTAVFLFSYFVFILNAGFQYAAYKYYLMDSFSTVVNIVLFRSFGMTMFWLIGFALAMVLYRVIGSWLRYVFLLIWTSLFAFWTIFWFVNLSVLYFSGFYISPLVLAHADKGAEIILLNNVTYIIVACFIVVMIVFIFIFRHVKSAHYFVPRKHWYYYALFLLGVSIIPFAELFPFQNLPDFLIVKSFYQNSFGFNVETDKSNLSPVILAKLKNFGLNFNLDESKVAHKEEIFKKKSLLLPDKFYEKKPNILIVFFESMSARYTDVYNPKFTDLTPGFDEMVKDSNTTIFKNYFNSSTPTFSGLYSQLCSFLLTTSSAEISENNKTAGRRLLCLPEIVKKYGGYNEVEYALGIDKTFANTGTIFEAMGVDSIYDWYGLSKYMDKKPLSWGYSDHQIFPVVFDLLSKKSKNSDAPWFFMVSTLDTHLPYNLPKDIVLYKDGEEKVLNTVHTSDDAFLKFWEEFKGSDLYKNTIVIVTADHAMPPGALNKKYFDDVAVSPYDKILFMMYIPDNILKKEYDIYSSQLDFTPTILHLLGINIPNSFEGHSIFDDRANYPYLLGMDEYGIYINIPSDNDKRFVNYGVPSYLQCDRSPDLFIRRLTSCEGLSFYNWEKKMWKEGRF